MKRHPAAHRFCVLAVEFDSIKIDVHGPFTEKLALLVREILVDQHRQWATINNGGESTVSFSAVEMSLPGVFPENAGWLRTGVRGSL